MIRMCWLVLVACFFLAERGLSDLTLPTVFAIKHWGCGGAVDIGIGNSEEKAMDWTFSGNAAEYVLRRLVVFVK
ncbi:hypothetical protein [Tichowtungia aerotolerans]|uniref:Uncharacterized protein n=1 Tax=Tichowtungia aerotolerans TaxID=2697043 RepID=A0A6P1M5X4_9BACT|nr:hypothetical protein [Tichowtungia aerotolerans]QHI69432.1 hypothetical protein GT409_08180 [Tichowtungia aerotolerans]